MRLIQLKKGAVRRVALVAEPYLHLLDGCSSIYSLANLALAANMGMSNVVRQRDRHEQLEYGRLCDRELRLPARARTR